MGKCRVLILDCPGGLAAALVRILEGKAVPVVEADAATVLASPTAVVVDSERVVIPTFPRPPKGK